MNVFRYDAEMTKIAAINNISTAEHKVLNDSTEKTEVYWKPADHVDYIVHKYQKGAFGSFCSFEELAIEKLNGRIWGIQRVKIYPCLTVMSEIESDNKISMRSSFILFLWMTAQNSFCCGQPPEFLKLLYHMTLITLWTQFIIKVDDTLIYD